MPKDAAYEQYSYVLHNLSLYLKVQCNNAICVLPILFLPVKVVVGGPPGQKVSAQILPKEGESGRIDGPVPLRTTLIAAMAM